MPASSIMIIRHAEEPDDAGTDMGVDRHGTQNAHQLSVRGWQRAGALVRCFNPLTNSVSVRKPGAIFATAITAQSKSLRSQSTVAPLAKDLAIDVDRSFAEGQEAELLQAVMAAAESVLICWHHGRIPAIVAALGTVVPAPPPRWPGARYDLVWLFARQGSGWGFTVMPQLLLPGDQPV
jgi:hypothetical protein